MAGILDYYKKDGVCLSEIFETVSVRKIPNSFYHFQNYKFKNLKTFNNEFYAKNLNNKWQVTQKLDVYKSINISSGKPVTLEAIIKGYMPNDFTFKVKGEDTFIITGEHNLVVLDTRVMQGDSSEVKKVIRGTSDEGIDYIYTEGNNVYHTINGGKITIDGITCSTRNTFHVIKEVPKCLSVLIGGAGGGGAGGFSGGGAGGGGGGAVVLAVIDFTNRVSFDITLGKYGDPGERRSSGGDASDSSITSREASGTTTYCVIPGGKGGEFKTADASGGAGGVFDYKTYGTVDGYYYPVKWVNGGKGGDQTSDAGEKNPNGIDRNSFTYFMVTDSPNTFVDRGAGGEGQVIYGAKSIAGGGGGGGNGGKAADSASGYVGYNGNLGGGGSSGGVEWWSGHSGGWGGRSWYAIMY